jgi:hypothetical protein
MKRLPLVLLVLAAAPAAAIAQTAAGPPHVLFGGVGHARTADDEGLLGSGVAVTAGAGRRLTERLTVQAVVDRIPYHRDAGYLAFDGRVLFAGAEAAFAWHRRRVRPLLTVGAGIMDDRKRWTHRTPDASGRYRKDQVTTHRFTRAAMRASGGVEIPIAGAMSVRAGLTFHGLLGTGDDLAAHVILQPSAVLAWRW